jgi:hypothetical protein
MESQTAIGANGPYCFTPDSAKPASNKKKPRAIDRGSNLIERIYTDKRNTGLKSVYIRLIRVIRVLLQFKLLISGWPASAF